MTNYDNTTPASQDDDLNLLVDMVMPAAVERFPPQGRLGRLLEWVGTSFTSPQTSTRKPTRKRSLRTWMTSRAPTSIVFAQSAFVSVVRHGGGDGIRVAIDRQKGGAVSVVFPASRKRLTEKVDLGEPSVAAESGWLWTESDAAANPSAPDWRDETPQHVQDDFDALFAQLVPFAEQTLSRYGEMYPFGAAILRDGTGISTVMPYSRDSAAKTVSFAGGRTRLARTRVWTL